MTTIATSAGPVVDAIGVTLRLHDPHARLRGVRLSQDIRIPGDQLDFSYRRGWWTLRVQRPAVDRMEYLLELRHPNEGRETIPDPANPLRVSGAFGDKSVIEFPDYHRPAWLDLPLAPASVADLAIGSRELGSTIRGRLWSPQALEAQQPAPLLIVHDGPEYDSLAGLTTFTGALIEAGRLPMLRVALLAPGDRNRWYAVNPAYARALAGEVLPALAEAAPSTVRVGAGASLGALAMLHAHRQSPNSFDGLFLQSGSFFSVESDAHERRFARFGPVTRFVREVVQAVADPHPLPVSMTCGVIEENLANNQAMAAALRRLGYPVELREVRDVHNYTAWRDAFDPQLVELIQTVVGS
ncbi:MAG TPA: alpha/beta hydrolase-fold protein [Jatrophihabitans sp.]|jgi:enterochelin esterase family protein|uniref:alpha/beta hydrolase n=1 Tax=Jatrophihabitans sp. TaxID=1932789 RepID=UPI002EDF69B9